MTTSIGAEAACTSCGTDLAVGALFCVSCGSAVPRDQRAAMQAAAPRRRAWFDTESAAEPAGPADGTGAADVTDRPHDPAEGLVVEVRPIPPALGEPEPAPEVNVPPESELPSGVAPAGESQSVKGAELADPLAAGVAAAAGRLPLQSRPVVVIPPASSTAPPAIELPDARSLFEEPTLDLPGLLLPDPKPALNLDQQAGGPANGKGAEIEGDYTKRISKSSFFDVDDDADDLPGPGSRGGTGSKGSDANSAGSNGAGSGTGANRSDSPPEVSGRRARRSPAWDEEDDDLPAFGATAAARATARLNVSGVKPDKAFGSAAGKDASGRDASGKGGSGKDGSGKSEPDEGAARKPGAATVVAGELKAIRAEKKSRRANGKRSSTGLDALSATSELDDELADRKRLTRRRTAAALAAVLVVLAGLTTVWAVTNGRNAAQAKDATTGAQQSRSMALAAVTAWQQGNATWASGDIATVCTAYDGVGVGGMWPDRATCISAEQQGLDKIPPDKRAQVASMVIDPTKVQIMDGDAVVIWLRDATIGGVPVTAFRNDDFAVMRNLASQGWRQVGARYSGSVVGTVPPQLITTASVSATPSGGLPSPIVTQPPVASQPGAQITPSQPAGQVTVTQPGTPSGTGQLFGTQ